MASEDSGPREELNVSTSEPKRAIPLERRDWLRSIGSVGTASVLGGLGVGTTGSIVARGDFDWETQADDRIDEHRRGDFEVTVADSDGAPVEGAIVDIEMQKHDYGFGGMIDAEFLVEQSEWGSETHTPEDQAKYRETVEELFNLVVLENLHKWALWEDNVEIADDAVEWALERDIDVRGHVCIWGNVDAHAIPADVVSAMGEEWEDGGVEDPEHDPEYVVEASMNHIEEIISHYGDDVHEWEVVNEVIHETAIIEAIEGEDVDPVEAEIVGDWYEHAEAVANEYGVQIAVNDYNTLEGAYEDTRADYERQLDYLIGDRSIELDGIGFQCHFADHETLSSEEILAGLERFEEYGVDFRATEFDTFQGEWSSSAEQGEYLYEFLKTFFSHPDTEAFVVWGHWDGVHWAPDFDGSDPDGVFFDEEWNKKPAYDHYVDLVFDEWWTDESGRADENGVYATSVFLGEHDVTATVDGVSTTETVDVTDADGTTAVEIVVNNDSDADERSKCPEWNSDTRYEASDRVVWSGTNWQAQWGHRNQEPGTNRCGPWEEL